MVAVAPVTRCDLCAAVPCRISRTITFVEVYTSSPRMTGPSKVIVLDPDARAAAQVQLGFEREGITTSAPAIPADLGTLALANGDAMAGLALVGGGIAVVKRARAL